MWTNRRIPSPPPVVQRLSRPATHRARPHHRVQRPCRSHWVADSTSPTDSLSPKSDSTVLSPVKTVLSPVKNPMQCPIKSPVKRNTDTKAPFFVVSVQSSANGSPVNLSIVSRD